LCIEHDRACHRRLDDDAPGDAERGAEGVSAGGQDNVADGGVGERIDQAGAGAHRGPRRMRWRRTRGQRRRQPRGSGRRRLTRRRRPRRRRRTRVEVHLERRLLRNRSPGCGADADPVGEVRHEDPAVIGRAREPPVDARRHVDGLIGQVARQVVDRRAPVRLDDRRRKGPRGRRHRQVVVRHVARIPAAAELVHLCLVALAQAIVCHGVAKERTVDGSHARERAQVELHQHEIDIGPAGSSVVRGGEKNMWEHRSGWISDEAVGSSS